MAFAGKGAQNAIRLALPDRGAAWVFGCWLGLKGSFQKAAPSIQKERNFATKPDEGNHANFRGWCCARREKPNPRSGRSGRTAVQALARYPENKCGPSDPGKSPPIPRSAIAMRKPTEKSDCGSCTRLPMDSFRARA